MALELRPIILDEEKEFSLETAQGENWNDDPIYADGFLVPIIDGEKLIQSYEAEPILRFVTEWLTKMPWIMAGDVEYLALRNSPFCFGFEPNGTNVEFYFYEGTAEEVEELVFEPVLISTDEFAEASITAGEQMLQWVQQHLGQDAEEQVDVVELTQVVTEAKNAWAKYRHEIANSRIL